MPILAQAELAGINPLEYDLIQRAGTIGAIYGTLLLAGIIVWFVLVARWRATPPDWRGAFARLVENPLRGADLAVLVLVLLTGFIAVIGLRVPWQRMTAGWSLSEASGLMLLQSLLFHGMGLLVVVGILLARGLTPARAFGISRSGLSRDLLRGLVALLATLPVLLILTLLFHVMLYLLGHQPSLQEVAFVLADEPNRWLRIYFIVLAVLIAPVFEELLFRGFLLPVMARRYGVWSALLLTSFLFALIHGHLPSFATLFALSAAMGAAYALTGSLAVPIAMHALFNSITTAILLFIR